MHFNKPDVISFKSLFVIGDQYWIINSPRHCDLLMHNNPTNICIVNMPCTKIRSKRATAQSHNNINRSCLKLLHAGFNCATEGKVYIKIDIYFFSENISLIFRRLLEEIYARVVGILAKKESWRNVGLDISDRVGNHRHVRFGVKFWVNYYKYALSTLTSPMITPNR